MPQLSNNSFILTWSCVCVHVCTYAYIKRNFFTLCSECNKHDARNACDIEYWRKVNVVNELYYAVKVFRQWLERRFLERGAEMKTGMKRIRKSYRGRHVFTLTNKSYKQGSPSPWHLPWSVACKNKSRWPAALAAASVWTVSFCVMIWDFYGGLQVSNMTSDRVEGFVMRCPFTWQTKGISFITS